MNPKISQLLAERRIVPVRRDRKTVLKEIHGADYDLDKARTSLEENDPKWALSRHTMPFFMRPERFYSVLDIERRAIGPFWFLSENFTEIEWTQVT